MIQALVRHRSSGDISVKVVSSQGEESWFDVSPSNTLYALLADRLDGLDQRIEEIVRPREWPTPA